MSLAPARHRFALAKAGGEQNRRYMQNKNWMRFLEALILLPIVAVPMPVESSRANPAISGISIASSRVISAEHKYIGAFGTLAIKEALDRKLEDQKAKAQAIDVYFKDHNMPLEGLGMKMVIEADKNGFDWRLLPAIAVRESTGGKNACDYVKHNSYGWASCKIGFKSPEEAIEVLAKNLGGNNPNTANHYDNKTVEQILRAYNPPSIVKNYAMQVIAIMNAIGEAGIIPDISGSSSDPSAQKG